MTTFTFDKVYVQSEAVCVGQMEKDGPLGECFECFSEENYFGKKSYEQAEIELNRIVIDKCLKQVKCLKPDIVFGGDLLNQLCMNYAVSDLKVPFVGMYAACATSALVIGEGAFAVEHGHFQHVLAITSSHTQSAERQFRYPNEYGGQKKECSTSTVTASGALLLGNRHSDIRVSSFTVGSVVDWNFKDVNDMGKAMVPAAYQTIMEHFKNTQTNFDDYDLIVTGDLGKIGYAMLAEMIEHQRFQLKNKLNDCGIMIYDINQQEVYCGGSGCGCSMAVLCGKLIRDLKEKKMNRILLVATGCLHNVFLTQQHLPIPTIAHAICLERSAK